MKKLPMAMFGLLAMALAFVPAKDSLAKTPPTKKIMCKKQFCSLYETTAKGKAAWGCGLRQFKGKCTCTKTAKSCGTNWRGKTKYTYDCTCETNAKQAALAKTNPTSPAIGQTCQHQLCSLYETTAKGKAAWKCGLRKYKGNCYCQKTPAVCGKNWRGKIKYTYNCKCRAACTKTICAVYSLTAKGQAAWNCGWDKGYSTRRCSCKQTTTCGANWRGKAKYNFDCKCK